MALNFPNSPTNGQVYTDVSTGNRWAWDSANTCWKSTSAFTQSITIAASAPGSPVVGQLWWNQDYGRLLVYYNDGDSSQWVDASPSDYTSTQAFNQSNNAYAMANASYAFSNSAYASSNVSFAKANTALQNTSGVVFNGVLNTSGAFNASGKITASGGFQVSGNLNLGSVSSPGLYSYEYPYVRQYVGDGTGYSFALSKKSSGITTDMFVLQDITGNITTVGSLATGSRGITKGSMPAGSVLQVIHTSVSAVTTYSSISAWTDLTGFSLSITPSSSSSVILLRAVLNNSINAVTTINYRWVRNGSVIALGASGATGQASFRSNVPNAAWVSPAVGEYLDSPATTSAITYKLQFLPYDSGRTVRINNATAGGSGDDYTTVSSITAIEIAQ